MGIVKLLDIIVNYQGESSSHAGDVSPQHENDTKLTQGMCKREKYTDE
jgi:hypothetical protein